MHLEFDFLYMNQFFPFQNKYFWEDKDEHEIKVNWRKKCSNHIRSTFKAYRDKKKRPPFVNTIHWEDMMGQWATSDAFHRQCETNKRNRASEGRDGIAIYTGGARPVVDYVDEYVSYLLPSYVIVYSYICVYTIL